MPYKSLLYPLRVAMTNRIKTLISSAALTGIEEANVLNRPIPLFSDFGIPGSGKARNWPGIIVSNPPSSEADAQVTNASSDRGITVMVTIALQETDAALLALDADVEDLRLSWRQTILEAFVPRGILTENPAIQFHRADYVGGQVIDWNQYQQQKRWVSSLLFRFTTRRHNQ